MLFNSFIFVLFFITVFIIYWTFYKYIKIQNILLLAASYFFYGWWDWRFLSLIAFSTLVDYSMGLAMIKKQKRRKMYLLISIFVNLGLLGFFKYFNFFIDSWVGLWNTLGFNISESTLHIILPVGISFYTFQTMSYTIDIYRGKLKPTKNLIDFALYVSFFPQLVAGPIERASNLLPQIQKNRRWDHIFFKEGLLQMLVGFFRKVVIADSIGSLIDGTWNNPQLHNASTIAFAVALYSFQIYFDFSGYSDIAIGTAKLLGFEFKQNFNLPYFSTSITEFWRRWHISLSSWLKDYLYIPLGGNRKGLLRQYRNLFLTMLLGGLWHGSSWNFVLWGGIHGSLLAIEKRFKFISERYSVFKNLFIFILVSIIWVFFRAQNAQDAAEILRKLFSGPYLKLYMGNITIFINTLLMLSFALLLDGYLFFRNTSLESLGSRLGGTSYKILFTFFFMCLLLFYSDANNFIYFQF